MSLLSTTQINVDFSTQNYVTLNAKQYDRSSRFILVTCYNNGQRISLKSAEHHVYVRYRKPDNLGVFNTCEITPEGKILIDLTEQMLATPGIAYADLIIYEVLGLAVEVTETESNVEIADIDDNAILTTMTFVVNIHEVAFDNKEIESSYEFNALNDLVTKAEADYTAVMESCNESELNASNSESNAKASEEAAALSEAAAKSSESKAKISETNASTSETNAKTSEENAKASEEAADESEVNAKASEEAAKTSEENAKASEEAADESEANAKASEENAKASEEAAAKSENNAKASEEIAVESANLAKSVADGLNSGFIPIGTISFEELATAEKATGFTYNISNDFITDDTFREGVGQSYTAGTNVYYTADGHWDCFGGSIPVAATVDEVKTYLGI